MVTFFLDSLRTQAGKYFWRVIENLRSWENWRRPLDLVSRDILSPEFSRLLPFPALILLI